MIKIKFAINIKYRLEICRSVFLSTWRCILGAELTKNALFQTFFFGDIAHWEVGSNVNGLA